MSNIHKKHMPSSHVSVVISSNYEVNIDFMQPPWYYFIFWKDTLLKCQICLKIAMQNCLTLVRKYLQPQSLLGSHVGITDMKLKVKRWGDLWCHDVFNTFHEMQQLVKILSKVF
jgi:hypothetical protein